MLLGHQSVAALLALVIASALTLFSPKTVGAQSRPTQACWSEDELRVARTARLGADAFREPRKRTNPVSLPARELGAIRRVELPPGSKDLIALTFDLCEQPNEVAGYDSAIIDILRKFDVKATFFVAL